MKHMNMKHETSFQCFIFKFAKIGDLGCPFFYITL